MLKIEIGNGIGIHVEATGQVKEILTDLTIAFNCLYDQITAGDPVAQKSIKNMLRFAIMDDNGPFWKKIDLGADATAVRIEIPNK